jgi:hypothetical protein
MITLTGGHFDQECRVDCVDGIVIPVAGTSREYWQLRDCMLELDGAAPTLRFIVSARRSAAYDRRWISLRRSVPALYPGSSVEAKKEFESRTGLKLSEAWWMEGGYVTPASETVKSSPVLFTDWLRTRAEYRQVAQAWYELRFEAAHRYLFWEATQGLEFYDFGEAPGPGAPP